MSKMMKCKTCGVDIASSAKSCPSCGAKNKKPIYTKWWFWVLAILIVGGVLGNQSNTSSNTSTTTNTANNSDATEVKKEETIKVTPDELIDLYNENEVKADKMYKDKLVEITGKIDTIGVVLNSTYVTLQTSDEYAIIRPQCTFDNQEDIDKIAELSKGDTVTIVGKVSGKSLNVSINDCTFK